MRRIFIKSSIFLLRLALILPLAAFSPEALCQTETQDIPAAEIYVIYVKGKAQIKPAGQSPVAATIGMDLKEGDEILAEPRSYVEIGFSRELKNTARIDAGSRLTLEKTSPEDTRFSLKNGKVFSLIQSLPETADFTVSTPTAVAGIRGTGFEVGFTDNLTSVATYEGTIYVWGIDEEGRLTEALSVPQDFETLIRRFEVPSILERISAAQERIFERIKTEINAHLKLFEQRIERERKREERELTRRPQETEKAADEELERAEAQSEQLIKEIERTLEKSEEAIKRTEESIDKSLDVIDRTKIEERREDTTAVNETMP